jgi:hypothetical protein
MNISFRKATENDFEQINALFLEFAKAENCKKVKWQVSKWNTNAISFYKSLGATVDDIELNCNYLV